MVDGVAVGDVELQHVHHVLKYKNGDYVKVFGHLNGYAIIKIFEESEIIEINTVYLSTQL